MESLVRFRFWTIQAAAVCILSLQAVTVVAFPVNSFDWSSSYPEMMTSHDLSVAETSQVGNDSIVEVVLENTAFDELGNISNSSEMDAMELILRENERVSEDMKELLVEGDILIATNHHNNPESSAWTKYKLPNFGSVLPYIGMDWCYFRPETHDIHRRNVLRERANRWPGGVVPYVIDQSFDNTARTVIVIAFKSFQTLSCIRFVRRTNQTDYLNIVPKDGCWSSVGRIGGAQELSLGDLCISNEGTIIHELMHALGFEHEHSRTDRDEFVTIMWDNIESDKTHNFQKYNQTFLDDLNTSYDFKSIMHYNREAFSKNGQPTIVPKQMNVVIGNRIGFSNTDLIELKRYYECSCTDRDSRCKRWSRKGFCETDESFMFVNCKKSCHICGPGSLNVCTDKNDLCSIWQTQGYCATPNRYMQNHCKRSCGFCHDDQHEVST